MCESSSSPGLVLKWQVGKLRGQRRDNRRLMRFSTPYSRSLDSDSAIGSYGTLATGCIAQGVYPADMKQSIGGPRPTNTHDTILVTHKNGLATLEKREMLQTQEQIYRERSRAFLVKARTEFDAGDLEQASEKAWGAAAMMVKAVAERRGVPNGKPQSQRHLGIPEREEQPPRENCSPLPIPGRVGGTSGSFDDRRRGLRLRSLHGCRVVHRRADAWSRCLWMR